MGDSVRLQPILVWRLRYDPTPTGVIFKSTGELEDGTLFGVGVGKVGTIVLIEGNGYDKEFPWPKCWVCT